MCGVHPSQMSGNSEVKSTCDLASDPGLRKIGQRRAISRKRSRPFRFLHQRRRFSRQLPLHSPLPLTIDRSLTHPVVECRGEMPPSTDLLQGTLDLLILKTLALEPAHGWGIAQRIEQVSNNVLQVGQGSLYPALHRLEYKGWIQAKWGASENNRRARFYSLTPAGKRRLEAELANWDRLTGAINLVLESGPVRV